MEGRFKAAKGSAAIESSADFLQAMTPTVPIRQKAEMIRLVLGKRSIMGGLVVGL